MRTERGKTRSIIMLRADQNKIPKKTSSHIQSPLLIFYHGVFAFCCSLKLSSITEHWISRDRYTQHQWLMKNLLWDYFTQPSLSPDVSFPTRPFPSPSLPLFCHSLMLGMVHRALPMLGEYSEPLCYLLRLSSFFFFDF